jgi:lipopolysaccharide export system permease protein
MSILDRYLLRQYAQVLVICFSSLIGLYSVIDALGHLDQFTAHAERAGTSLLAAIGRFYAFQSLGFFDRTSGILAMMAAMFTMAWFKRNNELTAMMAAGIPQLRAAMPLLIASGVISILAATSREFVLPNIRNELLRDTKDLAGTAERTLRPLYDPGTEVVLGGESTVAEQRRIVRPFLLLPTELAPAVGRVGAAEARYLEATEHHGAGYLLRDIQAGEVLLQQPSLTWDGQIVLYSPSDTAWLDAGQLFFPSEVGFDQLAAGPKWRNFASTSELLGFVKRPASDVPMAAYVTLHGRLVRPLLDMSLVVIGLPLILSRRGRSPFLAVGLAMALVAGFLLVSLTCEFLGNSGWISPSLAAWLPLFLFVPLSVANSGALRR